MRSRYEIKSLGKRWLQFVKPPPQSSPNFKMTNSFFIFLTRMRALTTKFNDRPQESSRPFDSQRSGFVMGEGAGIMILEVRCGWKLTPRNIIKCILTIKEENTSWKQKNGNLQRGKIQWNVRFYLTIPPYVFCKRCSVCSPWQPPQDVCFTLSVSRSCWDLKLYNRCQMKRCCLTSKSKSTLHNVHGFFLLP